MVCHQKRFLFPHLKVYDITNLSVLSTVSVAFEEDYQISW